MSGHRASYSEVDMVGESGKLTVIDGNQRRLLDYVKDYQKRSTGASLKQSYVEVLGDLLTLIEAEGYNTNEMLNEAGVSQ